MVGWLQSKQRPWFNQLKQEDVRGGAGEVAATIFSPTATCQKRHVRGKPSILIILKSPPPKFLPRHVTNNTSHIST